MSAGSELGLCGRRKCGIETQDGETMVDEILEQSLLGSWSGACATPLTVKEWGFFPWSGEDGRALQPTQSASADASR